MIQAALYESSLLILSTKALDDQYSLTQGLFYFAIPSQLLILFSMSYFVPMVTRKFFEFPYVEKENEDIRQKSKQLRLQLLNNSEAVDEL